jgi:iron complex outermembrane recepter protein
MRWNQRREDNMNPRKWLTFSCAAAAFFTFQSSANAQPAAPAPTAPATADDNINEEIVVITAERREQNLQDVPVAVSAYTSKTREKIGIDSVQDVANFTPGLAYSTILDRITLRGIGRQTNNLASDPGVATYSDGVYSSSTVDAGKSPMLADRVEVLRGPVGTLYGRNAIGGAINVISKRPKDHYEAEARLTVSNFDRQLYQAEMSGPFSDEVRAKIGGSFLRQGEGYFHNYANGDTEGGDIKKEIYVEPQLEVDFSDRLSGWLKAGLYTYDKGYRSSPGGFGYTGNLPYDTAPPGALGPAAAFGFSPFFAPATQVGTFTTNPGITDIRGYNTNREGRQTSDSYSIVTELKYDFDNMVLKYTGGGTNYHYDLHADYDGTPITSYTIPSAFIAGGGPAVVVRPDTDFHYAEFKQWWSHELTLASSNDKPFQWIVGGYFYDEDYHQPLRIDAPDQTQLATPFFAAPNPTRSYYYNDTWLNGRSYAGFGQIDWKFAEKWKTTLGLRYTKDEKDATEAARVIFFDAFAGSGFGSVASDLTNLPTSGVTCADADPNNDSSTGGQYFCATPGAVAPAVYDPVTGNASRRLSADWGAWTGTAGLQWEPDPSLLAYAKYTRGYKAGGFNSGAITRFPKTNEETVDAYELGLKKEVGNSLRANASLFYYKYHDLQIPIGVPVTVGPARTDFINIPESESIGFELESTWSPTDNLQFLLNYAYLDATIKDGCCYVDSTDPLAGGQDVGGNQLPQSPKNKVAVNGTYTFHFNPGSLSLGATYIWRDKNYGSIFTRDAVSAPVWDQIDLRAYWRPSDTNFTVIGYVKNATDEIGYDGVTPSRASTLVVGQTYGLTPPRTFGVEVQAKF